MFAINFYIKSENLEIFLFFRFLTFFGFQNLYFRFNFHSFPKVNFIATFKNF
jgi:hypothetical protein